MGNQFKESYQTKHLVMAETPTNFGWTSLFKSITYENDCLFWGYSKGTSWMFDFTILAPISWGELLSAQIIVKKGLVSPLS